MAGKESQILIFSLIFYLLFNSLILFRFKFRRRKEIIMFVSHFGFKKLKKCFFHLAQSPRVTCYTFFQSRVIDSDRHLSLCHMSVHSLYHLHHSHKLKENKFSHCHSWYFMFWMFKISTLRVTINSKTLLKVVFPSTFYCFRIGTRNVKYF